MASGFEGRVREGSPYYNCLQLSRSWMNCAGNFVSDKTDGICQDIALKLKTLHCGSSPLSRLTSVSLAFPVYGILPGDVLRL